MPTRHTILASLRPVALFVLALLVLVAPVGRGALAASGVASDDCPCEALEGDAHEADPCEDPQAPCEDACPDGCPDCGCCPVVTVAVLDQAVVSRLTVRTCTGTNPATGAPPAGCGSGVFRPPRSRA